MPVFSEGQLEQTTLVWFESLGYSVESGPEISPCEPGAERVNYDQVILLGRLKTSLENINPNIPPDATPVGLMSGEQLVLLLIENGIGVLRRSHNLFELEECEMIKNKREWRRNTQ